MLMVAPPLGEASNHHDGDAVHGRADAIGTAVHGFDRFERWFLATDVNEQLRDLR